MNERRISRKEFEESTLEELINRARGFDDYVEIFSREELIAMAVEFLQEREFGKANTITIVLEDCFGSYYFYNGASSPKAISDKSDLADVYEIIEHSNEDVARIVTILSNALEMLIDRDIEEDNLVAEAKQIYLDELGTTREELIALGIDWDNM